MNFEPFVRGSRCWNFAELFKFKRFWRQNCWRPCLDSGKLSKLANIYLCLNARAAKSAVAVNLNGKLVVKLETSGTTALWDRVGREGSEAVQTTTFVHTVRFD